jgi:hypothetical protein
LPLFVELKVVTQSNSIIATRGNNMPNPNTTLSQNIVLRNLTNPPKKGNRPPIISTVPSLRSGFRPRPVVLFADNFDNQPDWHSAMHSTETVQRVSSGDTLPVGWTSARQEPVWAPSTGHNDRMENISILASNVDKARGGVGKSAVFTRDSNLEPSWFWNSDGALVKVLDTDQKEIYAEFWIRFSDNWTVDVNDLGKDSKIFRISSWNRQGSEYTAFEGGNLGPIAIWNWNTNEFGLRNKTTLRGGPHGDNYIINPNLLPTWRGSSNFTDDTVGEGVGGSTPQIPDLVNGGFISDNMSQTVTHPQIFGSAGTWTKMAFYVRMNSSPNISDGVFKQWINDTQIMSVNNVPWVRPSNQETDIGWNLIEIGGNDFFKAYPDEDRRQEWYAIDDLVVYNGIPDGVEE